MPQARDSRLGIAAQMKPDRTTAQSGKAFSAAPVNTLVRSYNHPRSAQVNNPMLETVRRLWWRTFDRLFYCVVLLGQAILDCICGPEPPTPADLQRARPSTNSVYNPQVAR